MAMLCSTELKQRSKQAPRQYAGRMVQMVMPIKCDTPYSLSEPTQAGHRHKSQQTSTKAQCVDADRANGSATGSKCSASSKKTNGQVEHHAILLFTNSKLPVDGTLLPEGLLPA